MSSAKIFLNPHRGMGLWRFSGLLFFLGIFTQTFAAITIGTKTQLNQNPGGSSQTWSHNQNTGSDRTLLVVITMSNTVNFSSVTYAGTAMTQVRNQEMGALSQRQAMYVLQAPATGANNIVASYSGNQWSSTSLFAVSFTGAGGVDVHGGNGLSNTPHAQSLTIAANSVIYASGVGNNAASTYDIAGSNRSLEFQHNSNKQVAGALSSTGLSAGVIGVSTKSGSGTLTNSRIAILESASNTAPTISIDASTLAYTENVAATQVDIAATSSDADGDADWNTGTLVVQITASNEAADELSILDNVVGTINTSGTNLQDGATVIGTLSSSEGTVTNGTALTITFNSNATNALVQEVVQSIHYRNTSDVPSTSNRTVTYTVTDANAGSNNDARVMSVASVNDAPTISIDASTLAYTENAAATQVDVAATSSDADGDADWNTGTLVVQITASNEVADELSILDNVVGTINTSGTNLQDGATVIGTLSSSEGTVTNGTALTITFNSNATNALVQEVVQSIHYRNTSDVPSTSNRTVTYTVTDANAGSNNDARVISVASVNEDPTISIDASTLAYTENAAATQVDVAAASSDADGDADWNTGTLVVQITASNEAADELSILDNVVGTINTSGTNLQDGATVIGTLSSSEGTVTNGTALTITFNSNATNALVQEVVQSNSLPQYLRCSKHLQPHGDLYGYRCQRGEQ